MDKIQTNARTNYLLEARNTDFAICLRDLCQRFVVKGSTRSSDFYNLPTGRKIEVYGKRSKVIKIDDTKMTHANDSGRNTFHPSRINWSYLYLGKAARIQTKRNNHTIILIPNQKVGGSHCRRTVLKGGYHPPQKKIVVKVLITIIFAYSPRKNKANPMEEYSTLYPATNSASASGKSKGARLVSAKQEIKKIINKGNNGTQNQTLD